MMSYRGSQCSRSSRSVLDVASYICKTRSENREGGIFSGLRPCPKLSLQDLGPPRRASMERVELPSPNAMWDSCCRFSRSGV